jgi:hypothetical protein
MADLVTQDAPFGLNQVTFTPGKVADRLLRRRRSSTWRAGWGGAPGAAHPALVLSRSESSSFPLSERGPYSPGDSPR